MKTVFRNLFAGALVAGISASSASAAVSIDWVTVGNPGNAADSTGYGAVGYEYQIAENETTIGQYAEFLNTVAQSDPYSLYSTDMTQSWINGISRSGVAGTYNYTVNPGSANKPITFVSWFDAARFCNWLHNGQGNGSTETGAYTLTGLMDGIVQKNAHARFWIPTENEWYKAAYYDPTKGGTGGYWQYANQSGTMTTNRIGMAGAANFLHADGYYAVYKGGESWGITDVGAYGANSDSFYGTNDQGGNVWEWNDAVISGSSRGWRGGSWGYLVTALRSSFRHGRDPTNEGASLGFRVASVPEPAAMVLAMMFSAMLLTRRKK